MHLLFVTFSVGIYFVCFLNEVRNKLNDDKVQVEFRVDYFLNVLFRAELR